MDKEFIKEMLANYRLNKIIFWNLLFGLIGGNIWLIFRIIEHKGLAEIIFLVIGFLVMIILANLISFTNNQIDKFSLMLKNKR